MGSTGHRDLRDPAGAEACVSGVGGDRTSVSLGQVNLLLQLLFAASGCAALIYEIVWFQMLQLVIGSTAVSLGALLISFMGGLCLGSVWLPRRISTAIHPLRVWAFLELGIGALGFGVLFLAQWMPKLYAGITPGGSAGILIRGVICAVSLLPPTILMGATLPMVSRLAETTRKGVSDLGLLYGANTLGAVFGSLLAGFYLLRVHDVFATTVIAAAINAAIALIALGLQMRGSHHEPFPKEDQPKPAIAWPVYAAIALSGTCALGAEVVWTRLLSLMLGGTVYTFSIILAVFLFGLGIGSAIGAQVARHSSEPGRALGICQLLVMPAVAWAAFMLAKSLPYWPIEPGLAKSVWLNFQVDLMRCAWAILPATCLWGATFPLALAAAAQPGHDPAPLVGRLYAANTLGAIIGAVGCSILWIAWLGTQQTQRLLLGLSAISGLLVLCTLLTSVDGIGAGVLARGGNVWYANIPNLWLLRDTNGDGVADFRKSLHYGFGVRVGFLGHDLHGLHFGPDGKIYFSIGDRGSNIKVADGRMVGEPDMGCVFRCNPDGSDLEVFAYGLRNPQDLVFDQYGNLFTGDNNSDSGDKARWVYIVEGSDNGWRVGYQFMEDPYSRGPFNAERLWYPPFEGQPAYIVPPVANIASGPSGVAYFPGTGLPGTYKDHFFLVDFRGGPADSGVHTFTLQPKGAGFELVNRDHFVWNILATDVKFGVDGGLYVSDWVEGWQMTGKGRIYRVHDAWLDKDPAILETKRLLAEGMDKRSFKELARLLEYPDMRVRQAAQFEMADRGVEAMPTLEGVTRQDRNSLARLHGIWGIGQVTSHYQEPGMPTQATGGLDLLVKLLADSDPEVRAQSAKVLGDRRYSKAFQPLQSALTDANPRVRFFAAISLGKFGRVEAVPALVALLRQNGDTDPYIRHAGVMGLSRIGDVPSLLAEAHDSSASVRMSVLLALRRLQRPEIALFLEDKEPALVLEAARAINDEPINGAMEQLAELIDSQSVSRFLSGAPLVPASVPKEAAGKLGLEALLRRILNANFHFGTAQTARALAVFAARSEAPENMRVEALEELADWEHPAGIDRVIGLWRPVAAVRHNETAADALQPQLGTILKGSPQTIQVAALRCVEKLGMTSAASLLTELEANTNLYSAVRSQALKAIAGLNLPTLEQALELARKDDDEDLRKTAMRLESRLGKSDAVNRVASTLQTGTLGEKQNALATLATLPGTSADDLIAQWLDRLQSGSVPKELRLDVVEAAQKRNAESVKQRLSQYEANCPKDDPLASFEPTLYGGSAADGKKVFFDKPEAQCVRCHRIGGQGGDVGPDLSHVASQKDRHYLLESIVLPNKQIAQGFDSVTVVLKDGDVQAGVLKSETPTELVLNSADHGAVTLKKTDIQSRRAALSPMPEGLGQILSKEDLRNLVEFLTSLK